MRLTTQRTTHLPILRVRVRLKVMNDDWYIDNGSAEDALQSGLLTFVANRKHLDAEHVPMYIDLLRNLLNQAISLYK